MEDYFGTLFGTPDVTRVEGWDGREEPFENDSRVTWRKQQARQAAREAGQHLTHGLTDAIKQPSHMTNVPYSSNEWPGNTIDIDHEVVD
ncbi:MAG: hypothetical protein NVS3B25_32330 [Hymenobacter sp.]